MKPLFTLLFSIITLLSFAQIPSGAALWLKADAGVTLNGSTVSAWADQSGNGYNVSQATVASQPLFQTNQFNGQPALFFDGGDWLNNTVNSVVTSGTGRTVFIVARAKCNSAAMYYITFRRSTLLAAYQSGASSNFIYSDGVNPGNNASAPANWFDTLKAKPTQLSFYNSGIAPNKLNLRMNQQSIAVTQSGGVGTETGTTGFSVGRREDGSFFANGWIAEIIVYNSELNATDRTTVENYLATKYGTNLPPDVASIGTGKPTTASSTYAPNPQVNVNDDNACTAWNSGVAAPSTITIDLGTPNTINNFLLITGQSPAGLIGAGSKIEVSPDNSTWITAVNLSGLNTTGLSNQFQFQLPAAIANVRYVRANITSISTSWISIYELSVNPNLLNRVIKDITPVVLNADGSFNNGSFIIGETYYCSKAFTYQWKRNGVNIGGATNQSYIPTVPGNYTCTVTYECSGACNAALTSTGGYTGLPSNAIPSCGLIQNGTASGVTISNNALLNPTTAFTYEAWFKAGTDVSTGRVILIKGNGPYDFTTQIALQATTGKIFAATNLGAAGTNTNYKTLISTIAVNDNQWHHVALTYNAANVNLYLDGQLDATTTGTTNVLSTSQDFYIGSNNGFSNFIGTIDEVRYWNVAKTQVEIQDKLDEVLVGNETGLQAYYHFNDNLFNGASRLIPNKCNTTGNIIDGITYGTTTTPAFSCAAAPFTEPDCNMNVVTTGDKITVPSNAALNLNQFTVAAYVKTNQAATPYARIVMKNAGTLQQNYSLCINNGKAHIRFDHSGGAAQAEGSTNINDNIWHYVAGTYDGTNLRIYVDGTLQTTTAIAATPLTSATQIMELGQSAGAQQYIGFMDQVSVWNRALSATEITGNIGYNLAGNENGLVAYYNFNDNRNNGTGQTVINKATATGAILNGTTSGSVTTPVFSCSEVLPNRPACNIMFSGTHGTSAGKIVKLNANNNFSIELIVKPQRTQYIGPNSVTNTGYLFGKNPVLSASAAIWPGNTSGLNICVARNGIEVWEQNGFYNHQGRLGFSGVELNDWIHLAITSNNGALKLYVNGIPVSSAVATGANYSIYPIFGSTFGGNISEARFWDKTLTGAEVNTNINTTFTGSEPSLRALYRFNNSNTTNGDAKTIAGLGPVGTANPLTTSGNSQMPIFTCANYTPNTTNEAQNLPGSGMMMQTGSFNARGIANLNSWGNMPTAGSISFWFKPSIVDVAYPTQNIFSTAPFTLDKGGNKGIRIELNGTGQLNAIFGDDNSTNNATSNSFTINGSNIIEAGKWYHVVLTFNKTNNTFSTYLNGINTNLNTSNTKWPTVYRDINIGMGYAFSTANSFYNAWVDELAHYNIELTETQIRERMTRKLTSTDALWGNLLNYYRFDNNSNISPVVFDYKGNMHGMYFDAAGGTLSAAPIGDVSAYQYAGNSSFAKVNFGIGGDDAFTATMITGNADGVHAYGVNELPNTLTGVNLPIANNNRYCGVFVVNGDAAARYTAIYDYTNNPNVNATNEPQLKLFKRDNNAVTTWVQANNLSLNQAADYLQCTGQFTEYILAVNNLVLAYNQLNFALQKQNTSVLLRWDTYDEVNMQNFILERSIDGINFSAISNQYAKNSSRNFYTHVDNNPTNGTNYYRVKSIDNNSKFRYSKVLATSFDVTEKYVSVYNNPSANPTIKIENAKVKYVVVYDAFGKQINNASVVSGQIVSLNKSFSSGNYLVVFKDVNNAILTTEKLTIVR